MELTARTARIALGITLALASGLVLVGIWSFGIWDPWELTTADIARRLLAGEPPLENGALRVPSLGLWVVAGGFQVFGVHEWSGRLPIALFGLLAIGLGYLIVARFAGRRAGLYAALITGTTPIFLFNARQMLGAAPAFASQGLVFLCAMSLVFQPEPADAKPEGRKLDLFRLLWTLGLAASIALATAAAGFMVGVLPPLGAVAAVAIARGELATGKRESDPRRWAIAIALTSFVALTAVHVANLVAANGDDYRAWIGGAPRGGNPPTFEIALQRIFHSFAPWSALLPLAISRPLASRTDAALPEGPYREESTLRLALPLWAVFGFCAQTIYVSRFGSMTFLPVIALAGSIALFLRDVERGARGSWAGGVVTLLLAFLLVRDFRLYPDLPASGLGIDDMTIPENALQPSTTWAILLGLFGLLAVLGFGVDREEKFDAFRRDLELEGVGWASKLGRTPRLLLGSLLLGWPRRLLAEQWARGGGFRAWMVLFGLLLSTSTLFGVLCWVVGDPRPFGAFLVVAIVGGVLAALGWLTRIVIAIIVWLKKSLAPNVYLQRIASSSIVFGVIGTAMAVSFGILGDEMVSSLAVRIGRVLVFLVPGLVLVVGLARATRFGFHRLGEWALLPLLVAGLAVGGYTSFGFQPLISSHFSPREVYDAYNHMAAADEPLGEYRVGGRAAAYYARGEVRELSDQSAAIAFLDSPSRVWLAFRSDDLAQLDRSYRERSHRHLFVADDSSARVLLATNLPIEGREDRNYLANAILAAPPEVEHRVGANFDRRIELIGYDLDLPGGRTVGPGQRFVVTWYWRCITPVPGSYTIFLHIDGMGQRLNGDHEPVQAHYPVRLWSEGDIVVDRQELQVPANYPPGQYTFFIGFYAGEQRLDIVSGPADEVDRAQAGTLTVR